MRTVYALRFELTPTPTQSIASLATDLYGQIEQWIVSKYSRFHGISGAISEPNFQQRLPDGHSLSTTIDDHDRKHLIEVHWIHPDDRDPSCRWHIQATVGHDDSQLSLAVQLRIAADEDLPILRPVEFDLHQPRLVREVLKNSQGSISGWDLPRTHQVIEAAGVESFVADIIASPKRSVPVVVISPDFFDDQLLIDATELSESLIGFAHIAVLKDRWATYRLSDVVGKERSCFGGAARVYWPRFSASSNPFAHPLHLANTFSATPKPTQYLARKLFRQFAAASAFRFSEGPVINAARASLTERARIQHAQLTTQIKAGDIKHEQLVEEYLALEIKYDDVCDQLQKAREEASQLREARAWERYSSNSITSREVGFVDASQAEDHPPTPEFESVLDAFEQARSDFSGPLHFLDDAERSARESPFQQPHRVYECLKALASVAREWRDKDGALGSTWESALQPYGFAYKDKISQTSGTKFGDHYRFKYRGKLTLFEQHITIGAKQPDKCLSIHLFRDDEHRVVVIGWCGRHRKNTKT